MRRFNSYINGERENKFDPNAEVKVLNDEEVRIANGKKDFEDYVKKIEVEASKLKSLLAEIVDQDSFMFEFISAESKLQIKDEIKVEEVDFEEANNKRIHYKSNFLDVYCKVTEPIMSRFEYIQVIASIPVLGKNPLWTEKFDLYTNNESLEDLYFRSNTFVNRKTALKILCEPSEEAPIINEYNELKYLESGEEVKIAQEAGDARPYTDFFDEFVPNKMEESKRKHKYTVSIHKAICYAESLEVFKKFDK